MNTACRTRTCLVAATLLGLMSAMLGCRTDSVAPPRGERPPAPVLVTPVIEKQVEPSQEFVATVRPSKIALIGSAASGRVAECRCQPGDYVESGGKLAILLTETIGAEIDVAEAELQLRESSLEELTNGTRPEEIAQAKATMDAAVARRIFTKSRRERAEMLLQDKAFSAEARDEASMLNVEAENSLLAAKAAYDLAVAGPRREKIAQASAQVAMQAAIVRKLKDQERKHTIITRFAGYVTRELTEVGAWVNSGDVVFEVAALDEVEVEAFVTEQHIPHIHLGMELKVNIPALGISDDDQPMGTVYQIVPQADARTRTFPVRIRVTNTTVNNVPVIKAGMTARVKLPTAAPRTAMLVPKDAVVLNGAQRVVYVVDRDPGSDATTARLVPVEMDVQVEHLIQVSGDLKPGQLVVIEGNERLRPGQKIAITQTPDTQAPDTQTPDTQAPDTQETTRERAER